MRPVGIALELALVGLERAAEVQLDLVGLDDPAVLLGDRDVGPAHHVLELRDPLAPLLEQERHVELRRTARAWSSMRCIIGITSREVCLDVEELLVVRRDRVVLVLDLQLRADRCSWSCSRLPPRAGCTSAASPCAWSSSSLMRFCDSTASLSAAICAWTTVSSGTPFFSSAAAGQTSHARTTPESAVMDLRVTFVIAVSFRLLEDSHTDRAGRAGFAALLLRSLRRCA